MAGGRAEAKMSVLEGRLRGVEAEGEVPGRPEAGGTKVKATWRSCEFSCCSDAICGRQKDATVRIVED